MGGPIQPARYGLDGSPRDLEFDTAVLDAADIRLVVSAPEIGRRLEEIKQVRDLLLIGVDRNVQAVIQQCCIHAEIGLQGGLPFQVGGYGRSERRADGRGLRIEIIGRVLVLICAIDE